MTRVMSPRVTARAPGKLFVAGEYAVVAPGEPAVVVAVDRHLTAVVAPAETDRGRVRSPAVSGEPVHWTREHGGIAVDSDERRYGHVLSAIVLVDRLRAERGLPEEVFDLTLDSALDDPSGRKYGLGSSAASTVATIRALGEHLDLGLTATETFRLALLATLRVSPAASGGDLAAAVFGGWVGYRAPDRAALASVLATRPVSEVLVDGPWDGLLVEPLPAPRALRLLVGWTGTPASTDRLVGGVSARIGGQAHAAFLAASRENVEALWVGLRTGDDDAATDAVRRARALLRDLGRRAGVPIETERLTALCDDAEAHGAAAKSSGAGGGDCGIALAPESVDAAALARAWESRGILPLDLSVAPSDRSPRERGDRRAEEVTHEHA